MRKLLMTLLLLIFYATLFSQTTASLTGRVTDKQTNAGLPGATVIIKAR